MSEMIKVNTEMLFLLGLKLHATIGGVEGHPEEPELPWASLVPAIHRA